MLAKILAAGERRAGRRWGVGGGVEEEKERGGGCFC